MQPLNFDVRAICAVFMAWMLLCNSPSYASDHLDTPSALAHPQADIGDIYAWTSSDGKQLNLVMDIVGKSFSNRIKYVLHVDSRRQFRKTTSTTTIVCRFPAKNSVYCRVGDVDYVRGDATSPEGLQSHNHRFRMPEVSPYADPQPSTLPVHVIYQGRPLPGALVKLTNLEHDANPVETHLTGQAGRAVFTMPKSGSWLLNVIWTKPLPPSRETDFETVFSSLSFGLPPVRP